MSEDAHLPLSEAAVLRTQRNNLMARVLDLEVEVALLQDELKRLRRTERLAAVE
jgi:hypothetical protein